MPAELARRLTLLRRRRGAEEPAEQLEGVVGGLRQVHPGSDCSGLPWPGAAAGPELPSGELAVKQGGDFAARAELMVARWGVLRGQASGQSRPTRPSMRQSARFAPSVLPPSRSPMTCLPAWTTPSSWTPSTGPLGQRLTSLAPGGSGRGVRHARRSGSLRPTCCACPVALDDKICRAATARTHARTLPCLCLPCALRTSECAPQPSQLSSVCPHLCLLCLPAARSSKLLASISLCFNASQDGTSQTLTNCPWSGPEECLGALAVPRNAQVGWRSAARAQGPGCIAAGRAEGGARAQTNPRMLRGRRPHSAAPVPGRLCYAGRIYVQHVLQDFSSVSQRSGGPSRRRAGPAAGCRPSRRYTWLPARRSSSCGPLWHPCGGPLWRLTGGCAQPRRPHRGQPVLAAAGSRAGPRAGPRQHGAVGWHYCWQRCARPQ